MPDMTAFPLFAVPGLWRWHRIGKPPVDGVFADRVAAIEFKEWSGFGGEFIDDDFQSGEWFEYLGDVPK